jgi:hypothetical protein
MRNALFVRVFALIIALNAWIGIGIHIEAQWRLTGSFLGAAWVLADYFTVTTNLLVAVVFSIIALLRPGTIGPRLVGFVTINIALVGVIYMLLLQGLVELTAGAAVANVLLHMVTPVLVPIFWLLCVPRGHLTQRDPFIWALYPIAYLVYALIRGTAQGHFSYPFINYVRLGIAQVAITVVIITLAYLAAGWAMVLLDKRLAR